MATKNYGVRIDTALKEQSSSILKGIGLEFPDAIRIFLTQVVNRGELPIELKQPNSLTLAAREELENSPDKGQSVSSYLLELKALADESSKRI
jgi:addiction module RelB/DinJ family antitoxin